METGGVPLEPRHRPEKKTESGIPYLKIVIAIVVLVLIGLAWLMLTGHYVHLIRTVRINSRLLSGAGRGLSRSAGAQSRLRIFPRQETAWRVRPGYRI